MSQENAKMQGGKHVTPTSARMDAGNWRETLRGYSDHGGMPNRKERRAFEVKRKKLMERAKDGEEVVFAVDVNAGMAMAHEAEFKRILDEYPPDGINPDVPVLHVCYRREWERNLAYRAFDDAGVFGAAIQALPLYVETCYLKEVER